MSEDINQEILTELRAVKALGRRVFWLLLLLLIASVLAFPAGRRSRTSSADVSWESVNTAMRHQDFHKALAEGRELVAQQPGYFYGEAYLGVIYLAMGDLTNAEAHYARAHELFPTEEAEKELAAVRKRLAGQSQPVRLLSQ